ncbi:PAS domain-containing protein [Pseudoalteromonas luteoviolacea]|uniref:ATP-binding protein n=1 Tax=Pseudoalteromonas luteoviolacea TaxID=43657 RepID=UPI001B3709B3|nr:ATP-binding protein [Pseudoalteromonas luteoviolacea]MBQ4813680.1 PAS domain-containing protein [Pseudoalteromonas luteoviolacea]
MSIKYRQTPWFMPAVSAFLVLMILLYFSVKEQSNLIEKELFEIKEQRAWQAGFIAEQLEQRLRYASASSFRLAKAVQTRLEQDNLTTKNSLASITQPYPDGSIRTREAVFSGLHQAGIYLPAGTVLTAEKSRHLMLVKETVEMFGQGALSNQFSDTWFMNEDGGIVIYWPQEPDFVFKAPEGFSYLGSAWLVPNAPPSTYWTPLMQDPIPELLMLSAVTPVYVDGVWRGSVGHDITLQSLLDNAQLLKGEQQSEFILLNEKGLVVASDVAVLLQTGNDRNFDTQLMVRDWNEAYQRLWAQSATYLVHKQRLYTMSTINSQGWVFMTSTPLQPVTDKIKSAFTALQSMAFLSIAAEVIILTLLFAYFHRRNKAYVKHLKDASALLAEEKLRYETLVDKIPSIVYRCLNDKYWTMLYLNGAVEFATGYHAEDFIDNKSLAFADIIYPDDQGMVWQVIQEALDVSGRFKVVYRVIHKNGQVRWMIERGGYSDNQEHIEGVITDITELKEAEQQLKVSNMTLDEKVASKTAELQTTNEELTEKTAKLQDSILTLQETQNELIEAEKMVSMTSMVVGMAHEINTPLGNVATAESTIATKVEQLQYALAHDQLKKSDLVQSLEVIQLSLQSNDASLKALLSLSERFQSLHYSHDVKLERGEFSLKLLATQIVEKFATTLGRKNIQFDINIDEGLTLHGSIEAIDEVLTKLIENSLKHGFVSLDDGHIWLDAHFDTHLHAAVITYRDNGSGISPSIEGNIFIPFASQALNQGGGGLGLSRVYNIIRSEFEGKIEFQSPESQQGVCFVITLPMTE